MMPALSSLSGLSPLKQSFQQPQTLNKATIGTNHLYVGCQSQSGLAHPTPRAERSRSLQRDGLVAKLTCPYFEGHL
jgi:hypothetical protein